MEHFKPQRKVFYLLILCALAVAGGNLAKAVDDNLHITFTTTRPVPKGSEGDKHIHVVWLATTSSNIISTVGTNVGNKRAVWAEKRRSSFKTWWDLGSSGDRQDDIDARTGATQTSFKTYNLDWNFRKLNGTEIPDGTYRLYFELTDDDSGNDRNYTYFYPITKGSSAWTTGPTTKDGYNNVTLTFTPGIVPVPVVSNSPATIITNDSARLNGSVNVDSDVTIYWGDNDGGTGTWDHQENVGNVLGGSFFANISSLLPDTTYYFRCYASNVSGTDWAGSSGSFMTEPATPVIDLSEESLDFGEVAVGSYADLTFDIANAGFGDDLIVESLEITGLSKSAYSIVSPSVPFNVAPGAPSQTVTVRFEPAVYAESYASVSIGNDDPDLTVADVSLAGTGTMDVEVSLSVLSGVGGICNAVVVAGSNLFVAQGAMLTILDASAPSALQLIGQVRLEDIILDIAVVGDTAYAAIGASGIQVVDITDLSAPVALAAYDSQGHSYEIASIGTTLCVADGANGLLIYDISVPDTPLLQHTCPLSGSATAVNISGTTAFVLDDKSGLQAFDITTGLLAFDIAGMTANWKLDGNASDNTGSYDGTVNGNPVWTDGRFDGALELDGVDDYLAINGFSITGNEITMVAWINGSGPDYTGIIATRDTVFRGMFIGPDNHLVYAWNDLSAKDWTWLGGPIIPQDQWAMVAVVIEPDKATAYVYTDGGGLQSGVNAISHGVRTMNNIKIGWEEGDDSRWFDGLIDNVRIYPYALDLSQIQSLGNAPLNVWGELELGQALAVSATTAYVADQLGNFFVVDITDPAAMSLLGQTRVSAGNGTSIAISGNYAFVTNATGVEVFDISVPATVASVGVYSSTQASDIAIVGTTAYLAEKGFGLRTLNLTLPTSPAALGDYSFQAMPKAVAAGDSAAIIADDTDGMQAVGLTDPANPEALSSTSTGALGYAQDVAVNGSLGYLANGLLGLQIVDLTDPAAPALLGSYPTLGFASSVAVSGTTAMVADGRIAYVLDASNSSSPSLNGQWISAGWAGGVAIEGSYGYVANGAMGIEVLNIGDATSAGSLEFPGVAYDIAVSGDTAYVAAGSAGLQILDVSTPASPSVITSFDTPGMALGVTIVGSRVCVADKYSVAVIDVSTPATPYLYALSDIGVNSLGTDVVNSRLLVADGNAGIAILRAHATKQNLPLGNFDGIGEVGLADLALLAGNWMMNETMLDVLTTNITDDINVNMQDYAIMASNWGLDAFDLYARDGHWKFDETTGIIAADSSGNAHNGVLNGGGTWQPTGGVANGALELDGIDDYVTMTGYKGITGTQSRTMSAWIKTLNGGTIAHWGTTVSGGGIWALQLNTSTGTVGALRLSVGGGRIVASTDLRDGQWHHVAAVLDSNGSPAVSEVKFYVDGEIETNSYIEEYQINTVSDVDLMIGSYNGGSTFSGLIDEVRIYPFALNLSQIQSLYSSP